MSLARPPGVQVAALPVGRAGPRCRCVARHVPRPAEEEIHHVAPLGAPFGGPDTTENRIPLCPTTHSSVHRLIRVHLKARDQGRQPDPSELVGFAPYTRRLARRALDWLDAKEA